LKLSRSCSMRFWCDVIMDSRSALSAINSSWLLSNDCFSSSRSPLTRNRQYIREAKPKPAGLSLISTRD
jgi:hypothetical protein